jgi:hypothetical protein
MKNEHLKRLLEARDAYYAAEEHIKSLMDPPRVYEDNKEEIDGAVNTIKRTLDEWLTLNRQYPHGQQ